MATQTFRTKVTSISTVECKNFISVLTGCREYTCTKCDIIVVDKLKFHSLSSSSSPKTKFSLKKSKLVHYKYIYIYVCKF